MQLFVLNSKIHGATITDTNLFYNGSISIDIDLMKEANLYANQQVDVLNINNGQRFTTYIIEAGEDSRSIQVNGAAARLVERGDIVIICAYATIDKEKIQNFVPTIIKLDKDNQIIKDS